METQLKSVKELLQSHNIFEIPAFQRPYVWKEEDIHKLLEPVIEILNEANETKKSRFLGTIVLKKEENTNKTMVIDGQQRLTTISLIFKVLYDKLEKFRENSEDFGYLFEYLKQENYLLKRASDGKPMIKISPLDFQKVIWDLLITKGKDSILEKTIYTTNYEIIDEFLSTKFDFTKDATCARIKEFLAYIEESLTIITIVLNETEDEFEIFETLNSLGVPLNTRDLIKNNILQHESPEHLALYISRWTPIFEKDDQTTQFWKDKSPKSSEEHQDFFFDCYLQIQLGDAVFKSKELYAKYKEYIAPKGYAEELDDIQKYADIYKKIFDPKEKDPFPREVQQLLRILLDSGRTIYYPFIIYFLAHPEKDKGVKISRVLTSYILARTIAYDAENKSHFTDKGGNKVMRALLVKIKQEGVEEIYRFFRNKHKKDESPVDLFPTFSQIKEGIEELPVSEINSKLLLKFLEEELCHKQGEVGGISDKIELEHIIPKKWQGHWDIPNKQEETIVREIRKLGNLTLLTGEFNKKILNFEYEKKLENYKESQLKLNQNLLKEFPTNFSFDSIKERAGYLADLLKSALTNPDDLI